MSFRSSRSPLSIYSTQRLLYESEQNTQMPRPNTNVNTNIQREQTVTLQNYRVHLLALHTFSSAVDSRSQSTKESAAAY